ncbi:MAG: RuBisCO large subunit C-terminal-like domain-containing protein [Candidatus Thermoplasmatota archaeon]
MGLTRTPARKTRAGVRDAVVATYQLAGDFPLADGARVVAMEQSTGTWTAIAKRTGSLEDRLAAWVVSTDKRKGTARIAFPLEIFEPGNVAGVLSIVAGNLFGLGSLGRARLVDLDVPAAFAKAYPGPGPGIKGIRKAVGSTRLGRPHGGTIVKPKVGLTPAQTASVAGEAALGGLDLIKDDETLTDQDFCRLAERTPRVMHALDRARDETGKGCLYAVNITAGGDDILRRLDVVRDAGANCVMVDVLTSGFDALAAVRRATKLPIHVHRTMHGALTRSQDFGIAMLPIARLVRLCGGDQLHIGSASGKMEHDEHLGDLLAALRDPWHGLTATFPVSSGGLHPASVPAEVKAFGPDVVLQAGGGIHGHPGGTTAGARAFMQAIAAAHAGRPLARNAPPELAAAIALWGKETYAYGT